MARRAPITFLFLGSDRVARVDIGPGPAFPVIAQRQAPARATEDPVPSAATALSLGGQAGKQVWIFWEGAWTQSVEIPAAAVGGLDGEALSRTLAFEVEPFSGLPAPQASTAGLRCGENVEGRQQFWVTQVPTPALTGLAELVVKAGARLGGVLHPGGLPRHDWAAGTAGPGNAEWKRVEVWDQATFVLSGKGSAAPHLKIINARAESSNWRNELPNSPAEGIRWFGRVEPPEVLDDDGVPVRWAPVEFPAAALPVEWLRSWAAELTDKNVRVPLASITVSSTGQSKLWLAALAIEAAALVMCALHYMPAVKATEEAVAKAAALEKASAGPSPALVESVNSRLAGIKADLVSAGDKALALQRTSTEVETEVAKLALERAELEAKLARAAAAVGLQRRRTPELMAAICDGESDTRRAIIMDVKRDGDTGVRLSGVCRRPADADDLAADLAVRLLPSGWEVGAANSRLREGEVELWDFDLRLKMRFAPSATSLLPLAAPEIKTPVKPARTVDTALRGEP